LSGKITSTDKNKGFKPNSLKGFKLRYKKVAINLPYSLMFLHFLSLIKDDVDNVTKKGGGYKFAHMSW
jgi:hypothetical protein